MLINMLRYSSFAASLHIFSIVTISGYFLHFVLRKLSDAQIWNMVKTVVASMERSWLIINNWQFKISNKLKYQCFVYSDQEDEDYNYDSPEASTQSAAYELQWNEADDDSDGLFIFSVHVLYMFWHQALITCW